MSAANKGGTGPRAVLVAPTLAAIKHMYSRTCARTTVSAVVQRATVELGPDSTSRSVRGRLFGLEVEKCTTVQPEMKSYLELTVRRLGIKRVPH